MKVTWHRFKHIYGTEAQRQANSPADFQRLTRQASVKTTLEVYVHAVPEHRREVQARIERVILPELAAPVS